MDLSTVMTKIDTLQYLTAKDFLLDIDLICSNALEYNPDKDPGGEEENSTGMLMNIYICIHERYWALMHMLYVHKNSCGHSSYACTPLDMCNSISIWHKWEVKD